MIRFLILLTISLFYTNLTFGQTEPAGQATNIQFVGIKAYGVSVNFSTSDADTYLILRSHQNITDIPVDGVSYEKGDWIGSAKVVGKGANTFHTIRESVANTEYHFAIYAFNNGAAPNYKTDSPLKGSVETKGKEIGNYYEDYRIDTDDAIDDLTDLIKIHNDLLYSDYRDLVENVLQKDTTILVGGVSVNREYIIGEYSNILHIYDDDIDFSDYNREHVTPRSWMPSNPSSNNDDQNETSDQHNLFLVKASVNQSLRSNLIFDEVVTVQNAELDSKNGTNINGQTSFEPRQGIKGNVARTLFYMMLTYDGVSGSWAIDNLLSNGDDQDVNILLQWHLQDPVDNFEIARNEYIYSAQNNRNPFIDFPEWVDCIDFKTLTLNGNCPLDTAAEDTTNISIVSVYDSKDVSVYPNPTKEKGFVKLKINEEIQTLELKTLNGEKIELNYDLMENISNFNFEPLSKGIYILKIGTKDRNYFKKLFIE